MYYRLQSIMLEVVWVSSVSRKLTRSRTGYDISIDKQVVLIIREIIRQETRPESSEKQQALDTRKYQG